MHNIIKEDQTLNRKNVTENFLSSRIKITSSKNSEKEDTNNEKHKMNSLGMNGFITFKQKKNVEISKHELG